ncbi:MAG: hypothetical protein IPN74_17035 [Haliscomenobacter sp.]|nr:hypothetical protein [Haliscomenobacter sp.]MBK8880164.1 hypothetical protein [Haliscomenobacter sp.]
MSGKATTFCPPLMEQEQLAVTTELLAQDFAIEGAPGEISEEQLLRILSDQVAFLIENRMEFLLSLMYRLDIDERKVDWALSPLSPDPPEGVIARLVLERQKQRAWTKLHYHPPILEEGWEDDNEE